MGIIGIIWDEIRGWIKEDDEEEPTRLEEEPSYDPQRCFFFHGIGGTGNEADRDSNGTETCVDANNCPSGNSSTKTNNSGTSNSPHMVYKDPPKGKFRPYYADANGYKLRAYMSGTYDYWEDAEGTFNEAGLGSGCDHWTVYDADSVNQGYNNADLMADACDMYLDGDDKVVNPATGVKDMDNPRGEQYHHVMKSKVVITHSMGGMYMSKNFASKNCQRMTPGGGEETKYFQSEPPMDGSRAATFNRIVCRLYPHLVFLVTGPRAKAAAARGKSIASSVFRTIKNSTKKVLKKVAGGSPLEKVVKRFLTVTAPYLAVIVFAIQAIIEFALKKLSVSGCSRKSLISSTWR
jgi:hypothetical protein